MCGLTDSASRSVFCRVCYATCRTSDWKSWYIETVTYIFAGENSRIFVYWEKNPGFGFPQKSYDHFLILGYQRVKPTSAANVIYENCCSHKRVVTDMRQKIGKISIKQNWSLDCIFISDWHKRHDVDSVPGNYRASICYSYCCLRLLSHIWK